MSNPRNLSKPKSEHYVSLSKTTTPDAWDYFTANDKLLVGIFATASIDTIKAMPSFVTKINIYPKTSPEIAKAIPGTVKEAFISYQISDATVLALNPRIKLTFNDKAQEARIADIKQLIFAGWQFETVEVVKHKTKKRKPTAIKRKAPDPSGDLPLHVAKKARTTPVEATALVELSKSPTHPIWTQPSRPPVQQIQQTTIIKAHTIFYVPLQSPRNDSAPLLPSISHQRYYKQQ